jgi:predicted ATPase
MHAALTLAQEHMHRFSLARALVFGTMLYQFRREALRVQEWAEAAMTLATEQGFPHWLVVGTFMRGWALAAQGQEAEGMAQMQQGLAARRATGAAVCNPYSCTMLADIAAHMGHTADGLQALAEAQTLVEQHEERWCEAEIHRVRGVVLLRQTVTQPEEAETCFQQALAVARRQQAKSWELRAATSLARLWQQQGKRQEAYDLLAPVYGWFTEGFDTADLHEAKALLDELA